MRHFLGTCTQQTVRFPRVCHSVTRLRFWQVVGVIMLTCSGLASQGLACHDAASAVRLTPTSLTFHAVQGAPNPPNQTIAVARPTTWSATFTTSDNASWLTVSPAKTTITTSKTLTVAVNTTGLGPGTYNAIVTTMVGTWCTKTEPVTLIISPPNTQPPPPTTKSATLNWNAVTGATITGYKVYVGEAPGQYSRTVTVGNVTSSTVNSLTVGRMYYFVVTAYNGTGESTPSNMVSKTIQ